MYILKIILGVIFLVILYTIIRTSILIKKSSLLISQAHKYERIIPNASSTFLFIGDSTTVGVGSETAEESIPGKFGEKFPLATIINEGVSGQKIRELLETLSTTSSRQTVDVLVIQIGANDIIRFTKLDDIKNDLDALLSKTKKISKKVIILHSGNVGAAPFFPPYLSWIWTERTRLVREIYINETKKYNVSYVDLFEERKDDIFLTDPNKYYASDKLHPTSEGYAIWFNKINKVLEKI